MVSVHTASEIYSPQCTTMSLDYIEGVINGYDSQRGCIHQTTVVASLPLYPLAQAPAKEGYIMKIKSLAGLRCLLRQKRETILYLGLELEVSYFVALESKQEKEPILLGYSCQGFIKKMQVSYRALSQTPHFPNLGSAIGHLLYFLRLDFNNCSPLDFSNILTWIVLCFP